MADERDFVVEEDRAIIESWADGYPDVMISFREAGAHTIRRLKEGAGAKPHKILDKTIKPGGGSKGQAVERFLGGLPDEVAEHILGLTGVWKGDEIIGIYLTAIGEMAVSAGGFPVEYRDGLYGMRQPYFPLSTEEERQALADFLAGCHGTGGALGAYYFARCFFAGDYDLHDLYFCGTPVECAEDRWSLGGLQEALMRGRHEQLSEYYGVDIASLETLSALTGSYGDRTMEVLRRMQREREWYHTFHSVSPVETDPQKLIDEDYQRVQHGPQSLYVKQMLEENVEFVSRILDKREDGFDRDELRTVYLEWSNGLVGVVTRSAFPVLAYSHGRNSWAMIQDVNGFVSWGITPDPVWTCQGAEYVKYLAEKIELIMLQAALVMRATLHFSEEFTLEQEIVMELTEMESKLSQDIRDLLTVPMLREIEQKVLREVSGY